MYSRIDDSVLHFVLVKVFNFKIMYNLPNLYLFICFLQHIVINNLIHLTYPRKD